MEGTLAEIRMFGGNFAPRGWMLCQGQLLSIAQWTAVFALVGTTYGGNGQTTFGVPDFRGRLALGTGQGPGQPSIDLGQQSGVQSTTLLITNLPQHVQQVTGPIPMQVSSDGATATIPNNKYLGPADIYSVDGADLTTMQPLNINLPTTPAGGGQPFGNQSPYLGINFIFCVEGIFPSRD